MARGGKRTRGECMSERPDTPETPDTPPCWEYEGRRRKEGRRRGPFARWQASPLSLRILFGLALGLVVGVWAGPGAKGLDLPARLIIQFLSALAPPLILF